MLVWSSLSVEVAISGMSKDVVVETLEGQKHAEPKAASPLTSIVSGEYALITGKLLKVRVDENMGENEDEFFFDAREIVVNGNHPAYNLAAKLDRVERYEIGVFVPALTVHITKCVCFAWAELHFKETKNWDDFKDRYDELRDSHL